LIINTAQCASFNICSTYFSKIYVFAALQQKFLFLCHGRVSTNHLPHQFGAQSLPVVGVINKYIALVKHKAGL
jgi:hypothetical protein